MACRKFSVRDYRSVFIIIDKLLEHLLIFWINLNFYILRFIKILGQFVVIFIVIYLRIFFISTVFIHFYILVVAILEHQIKLNENSSCLFQLTKMFLWLW